MIKFFRKIRQNLLSEGKTGKYLKYAIGEIVLVVIGILIALQINNWNDNNKKVKIERSYLEGIVSNLDEDIRELSNLLSQDTVTLSAYTTILLPFKNTDINPYSQEFIGQIGVAQFIHQFNGNSIVFEDMKASGKINFIQSNALRFTILEYYNLSSNIIQSQFTNNNIITKFKDEAFTTNLDLNSLIEGFMFEKPYSAELDGLDLSFFKKNKNDIEVKNFANRISLMKGYLRVNHEGNIFINERAKKLKELINKYLNGTKVDYAYMSEEIVKAILINDIDVLETKLSDEAISKCYKLAENYPISYLALSLERGALESAKYIIERGADLELTCFDKTPLMYATKYGHLEMVKFILEAGADINSVSIEGKTALDYAVNYSHPEIENYLKSLNAQ